MVVVKWFQFHGSLFEKIGTIWCLIANWFQFTSGCSCEMEPNKGTPLIWLHVRPDFSCNNGAKSGYLPSNGSMCGLVSAVIMEPNKGTPLIWLHVWPGFCCNNGAKSGYLPSNGSIRGLVSAVGAAGSYTITYGHIRSHTITYDHIRSYTITIITTS